MLRILDEEKLVEGARTKGEALGAMLKQLARDLPGPARGRAGRGLLWGLVMRPGLVAREILPRIAGRGGAADAARRERPALLSRRSSSRVAELEEGVRAVRRVLSELRTLKATA